MLINTKGSILESLSLFRGLEFGNETFHFDCDINLSRCSIERAGCNGECGCARCLRTYSRREYIFPFFLLAWGFRKGISLDIFCHLIIGWERNDLGGVLKGG